MALQIRRGTNAERLLVTPLQGELIFTTDTKKLYIGDGTTVGGVAVDTTGGGGGASALAGLTDVLLSSPVSGQVLKFNGTNWINDSDLNSTTLGDITDVAIVSPTPGQVLKFNGTAWINDSDLGGGTVALGDITDVAIVSPTPGQVLKFNGTNWVNDTDLNDGTGTTALDSLTDVAITTPTIGQTLKFDGTTWLNSSTNLSELGDVVVFTPTAGQILKYDGTRWNNVDNTILLDDLNDVTIGTVTTNSVLSYNGTNWVDTTLPPLLTGESLKTNIESADGALRMVDVDTKTFYGSLVTSDISAVQGASEIVIRDQLQLLGITDISLSILYASTISTGVGNNLYLAPRTGTVYVGSNTENGDLVVQRNAYDATFGKGVMFSQHHENALSNNFTFYRTRGTAQVPTVPSQNDIIQQINFTTWDGSAVKSSVGIRAVVDGAVSSNVVPGKLQFATHNGTAYAIRGEITKAGNLKFNGIESYTANQPVSFVNMPKLPTYADETAANAAVGGTPTNGLMFYDSGANMAKVYGNGAWHAMW